MSDDINPYLTLDEIVGDELLLDADKAAEQVANLISSFTAQEVDGDGDPWSIALEHLAGLLSIFEAVIERYPDVEVMLWAEYGLRQL